MCDSEKLSDWTKHGKTLHATFTSYSPIYSTEYYTDSVCLQGTNDSMDFCLDFVS